MQPCQLNFVRREDSSRSSNSMAMPVSKHVSRDYHNACDVARSVGLSRSISERLAKFLLESSAEGDVTNGVIRTKLALTHDEIGQIIGTCRESITRTLSEFREMKIVELKGSTLVLRDKSTLGRLVAA
jgi:CRP/FNR family transcriptional regulator, cyclic AMP receptor protein